MTEHPTDKATRHAIVTLLWSEVDEASEPLDDNYGPEDVALESREAIREDVRQFLSLVVVAASAEARRIVFRDLEQAGHDFILTRNHHGAGFWDRGYGDAGDELTRLAHTMGECYAYVGDDGKVHVQ